MNDFERSAQQSWSKYSPLSVRLLGKYCPLSNVLFAAGLYGIGLLVAIIKQQTEAFLRVWYLYVAMFGIAWVTTAYCWFFPSFSRSLAIARREFQVSDDEYNRIVTKYLRLMGDDKTTIIFSGVPAAIFCIVSIFLFYDKKIPMFLDVDYNVVFSPNYEYIILGGVYGILGLGLLLSSIRYFYVLNRLFGDIFALPINFQPFYEFEQRNIQEPVKVMITGVYSYFVGVALIGSIALTFTHPLTIAILAMSTGVGAAGFIYPQISYQKAISREKLKISRSMIGHFSSKFGESFWLNSLGIELLALTSLLRETDNIREWIVDVPTLLKLISSALLPLLTALIRTYAGF